MMFNAYSLASAYGFVPSNTTATPLFCVEFLVLEEESQKEDGDMRQERTMENVSESM